MGMSGRGVHVLVRCRDHESVITIHTEGTLFSVAVNLDPGGLHCTASPLAPSSIFETTARPSATTRIELVKVEFIPHARKTRRLGEERGSSGRASTSEPSHPRPTSNVLSPRPISISRIRHPSDNSCSSLSCHKQLVNFGQQLVLQSKRSAYCEMRRR
ncbi:hypothetical protein VTJ04DRAFT_953 [Mycothermus thermophilus]|uniref:uncharacterized protein n=1 Tax=Humicola insolens TaxID=85995 RepID=UPI00374460C9